MVERKKKNPEIEKILSRDAVIEVTKTVMKKTSTKVEKIKVRPFVTEPAYVHVKFGAWINTGDFSGVKADVGVTLPCYKEEIVDAFEQASKMADERLDQEIERMVPEEPGE